MGTCALPDMHALRPQACGPWASGIHNRQSTRAHVMAIAYVHYHHCMQVYNYTALPALPTYIATIPTLRSYLQ